MMRKLTAFLLFAAMLVGAIFPVSVDAQSASPTFALSDAEGRVGDLITVALSLQNNPGIISLKLAVAYDEDVLALTSLETKDFQDVSFGPLTSNPVAVNWIDATHPNSTANGTVAVLTFRILATDPQGETAITLSYDAEDVFDENYQNVTFATSAGTVTVLAAARGDFNQNGAVDSNDAIYLLRSTLNSSAFPLNQSGDVNGDGKMNSDDAIYLLRHTLQPSLYPLF